MIGVDDLPSVRFVDRFAHDGEVFYAEQRESSVLLYRVTGATEIVRALVHHDAVIHDGSICRPRYEDRYRTVDLHHWNAGRSASLHVDRILDEPAVTLEEVDRA